MRGRNMHRRVARLAMLLALATASASAQGTLPVPPGGDPALACGQKPNGRGYWVEYASCKDQVRGPTAATGLVFWSHGVSGDKEQYRSAMAPFLRPLLAKGWDAIKINRNNLYEHGWSASGYKHVADLIERARAARAQGYRRVIAAGQSYGGIISVEANAKAPDLFYAVVSLSPGHGSDARDGANSRDGYRTLDRQLLDVLQNQRTGRLILSLAPFDDLHPNRDSDPIWPKARSVLQATGIPFVLMGEGSPVKGHGAATTPQFAALFGGCLRAFLDPAGTPANGETRCLTSR